MVISSIPEAISWVSGPEICRGRSAIGESATADRCQSGLGCKAGARPGLPTNAGFAAGFCAMTTK